VYQAFDIHHSIIGHHWEHQMKSGTFLLLKSVNADANTILMPTLHVCICTEDTSVGVRQWAAATMAISQYQGGLTISGIYNIVRECIWEIAHSMSKIN
jgi:hypothetical protein